MDIKGRETSTFVLVAAAVWVAVIGMGLVAILTWTNNDSDPAPAADGSGLVDVGEAPDVPTATPAIPSPDGATTMERCISATHALRAPLAAARPAMGQWAVHVGAMNRLAVGDITLQQATDFWDRTRLGATRHVTRFNTAWRELRREGVDCPSPLFLAPAHSALRPCVEEVAAEIRALEVARTSITIWAKHLEDMDMLRLRMLSPEDATTMWLSMWQSAVQELNAYRRAAREEEAMHGCFDAEEEAAEEEAEAG